MTSIKVGYTVQAPAKIEVGTTAPASSRVEKGITTVVGPQGPPGPQGPQGLQGVPGIHVGPTPPADTNLIWVDDS